MNLTGGPRVRIHLQRRVIANRGLHPVALGQGFLSKFGAVTLDYKRLVLILSR
jgi:hypothetical protein